MRSGDLFATCYITTNTATDLYGNESVSRSHYADEYRFDGTETVTTPAGTFTDCVKMVRKRFPSSVLYRVYYYAPGVGMVKTVSLEGDYTQITELVSAAVDGVSLGSAVTVCSGTWDKVDENQTPVGTGPFSFTGLADGDGFQGGIVADDVALIAPWGGTEYYPMVSTDGSAYDYAPSDYMPLDIDVHVSLSGGALQGNIGDLVTLSGTCE